VWVTPTRCVADRVPELPADELPAGAEGAGPGPERPGSVPRGER
jgi:hypothetical protein